MTGRARRRRLVTSLAFSLAAAPAAAELCPALSVADAHALSRAQLEARVCSYVKTSTDMLDKSASEAASACLGRALDVEALYRERFGKPTACWPRKTPS